MRNINPTTRVNPGFDKSYLVKGAGRGRGGGGEKGPRINRLDIPMPEILSEPKSIRGFRIQPEGLL